MATAVIDTTLAPPGAPADRVMHAALVVAPLVYLAADATYAVHGWDSGTGGVLHVLGAIGCGIVVLRFNAAYGFEAIHQSLGDTPLVDRDGAALLNKPLGVLFPLALALVALAMHRLGHRGPAAAVALAIALWPAAHIANIAPLAVAVNGVLLLALGTSAGHLARSGGNP